MSKYCPMNLIEGARQNERNRDCLVRCYLGRRRRENKNSCLCSRLFGPRNYPLHLGQREELGFIILTDAKRMARALAVSHWRASVNMNDSEFVLGGPPTDRQVQAWRSEKRSADGQDWGSSLWLLDFDKSVSITMNEVGAKSAACAAFKNDPYLSRVVPDAQMSLTADQVDDFENDALSGSQLAHDHALWCEFKSEYLRSSKQTFDAQDWLQPMTSAS